MSYWREKTASVTGGSSGLGLVLAGAFARAGANVVLAARDPAKLEAARKSLPPERVLAMPADVTDPTQLRWLVEKTRDQLGRLDPFFPCAGISDRGGALQTPPERYRELWELNFLSAVHVAQATAESLIESQGHLGFIGSLASKTASRYLGAYPASKFPLAALAQQLRLELGPQGVHVLLACPGPIARQDSGSRYDSLAADLPPEARRPGGGVKLKGISPEKLAQQILNACRRRTPELVVPGRARLLFALQQLWPSLGDWILRRSSSG